MPKQFTFYSIYSALVGRNTVRTCVLASCIFSLLLFSQKLSKNNSDLTDSEHPYFNSATSYMSTKGSQPLLSDRYRLACIIQALPQSHMFARVTESLTLCSIAFPLHSIIVSTFNRVEHVHQFLHRYGNGQLAHLDAIFIAWVSVFPFLKLSIYLPPVDSN